MYFIPYALFIMDFDPAFVSGVANQVPQPEKLTWPAFLAQNLLPVTIGNIIGGAMLVAALYSAIFLRRSAP